MTTRAIIAIHADAQTALAALQAATDLPEALKEEHIQSRKWLYERLDYWHGRMSRESIEGYILATGFVDGWTLIEEHQMILPCDIELLRGISEKLHSTTGGFLLQTTSNCFGYIECRNGAIIRHFETADRKKIHDEGTLEQEPPPMINDPWNGVETAWHSLIPSSEPAEFEIRVWTKQTVSAEEVVAGQTAAGKSAKKPWWKVF